MRNVDLKHLLKATERALSRFDQDRRSARMIGELAVSEIRRRMTARNVPAASPRNDTAADPVHDAASERAEVDVHPLSLLGVADLLAAIEEMSPEDLRSLRHMEESGRSRPTVLDAIDRRLSSGTA